MTVTIETSDLLKILDCIKSNENFHVHRDSMNAILHLAQQPRYSPLTTETISTRERIEKIIKEIHDR